MDTSKRARTEEPHQWPHQQLAQEVGELLKRLSAFIAAPQSSEGADGGASQLDTLLSDLLRLQRQLEGTAAQPILDQAIRDALRQLEAATEALQAAVDKYSPPDGYVPPVAGGEAYVRDIIAYAHRLSYTTFAPPGFVPGQTQLRHFKPPAPQDFQLRSSLLHQFQRDYEARRAQAKLIAPAAEAEEEKDKMLQPPPMPAGWKPGMPILEGGGAQPAEAAAAAPAVQQPAQVPEAQPSSSSSGEEEEEEEPSAALPAIQRPQLASAFNLALNPDIEMVFGGDSSEEESEEEEEESG